MEITNLIPQRKPFLYITNFKFEAPDEIITDYTFKEDEYFFQGHFPDNPVVPGVILSEHCFQSGAALISHNSQGDFLGKLAVVSRIQSAKFKNIVRPHEKITTTTKLVEQIDNAAFFRSIVKNEESKKCLIIEFACALVDQ
jgi:3-hydroxyacyl-[acyl-carrier-protein] dehydratase